MSNPKPLTADEIAELRRLQDAYDVASDQYLVRFEDEDGARRASAACADRDFAAIRAFPALLSIAEHHASLVEESERMRAAARAVITQWDSPNWKLTEPTGNIIARLRVALGDPQP